MRADKRKTLSRIAAALFIMLHIMVYSSFLVLGADDALYVNSETGYGVYIYDDEDLLTDEEEEELLQNMIPLTTYGGAAFVSTSSQDAEAAVRSESHNIFNNASSTLFLIDMGAREIKLLNGWRSSWPADRCVSRICREASGPLPRSAGPADLTPVSALMTTGRWSSGNPGISPRPKARK